MYVRDVCNIGGFLSLNSSSKTHFDTLVGVTSSWKKNQCNLYKVVPLSIDQIQTESMSILWSNSNQIGRKLNSKPEMCLRSQHQRGLVRLRFHRAIMTGQIHSCKHCH